MVSGAEETLQPCNMSMLSASVPIPWTIQAVVPNFVAVVVLVDNPCQGNASNCQLYIQAVQLNDVRTDHTEPKKTIYSFDILNFAVLLISPNKQLS